MYVQTALGPTSIALNPLVQSFRHDLERRMALPLRLATFPLNTATSSTPCSCGTFLVNP